MLFIGNLGTDEIKKYYIFRKGNCLPGKVVHARSNFVRRKKFGRTQEQ